MDTRRSGSRKSSRKSKGKGRRSKPRSQWMRKDRPDTDENGAEAEYTDHLDVERELQAAGESRSSSGRSQRRRRKQRKNGERQRRSHPGRADESDLYYEDKRYPRSQTEYTPLYDDHYLDPMHDVPFGPPYPLHPGQGPEFEDPYGHSPPEYRDDGAEHLDDYDGSAETPVYEPVEAPEMVDYDAEQYEMDEDVKDPADFTESPPAKVYRLKPLKQPVRPMRPARGRYAPPFAPDAYAGNRHLDTRVELWNNDVVRQAVTDILRRQFFESRGGGIGMEPRMKKGRRKQGRRSVTEDESSRRKREAAADEEEAALKADREAAKKRMQKERINRIADVLRYLFSEPYLKTDAADYMKGLMDESEGWIKVRYLVSVSEMRELFHSSSVEGKPPRAYEIQKALQEMTKDLELTEDCNRVRRRNDWADYMLDPDAGSGFSKRALEAITYRVEDYHAKRAYYKAKAAAKRQKEEEQQKKKEAEEQAGQEDSADAGAAIDPTAVTTHDTAEVDAAPIVSSSTVEIISKDESEVQLQNQAVRAAGIDPTLDSGAPTLSFTDRGGMNDDDDPSVGRNGEEHIPHISFS